MNFTTVFAFLTCFISQVSIYANCSSEENNILLGKLEIMRSEALALIRDLKLRTRQEFVMDLKYRLSAVKTEAMGHIDDRAKKMFYRIKMRPVRTSNAAENCFEEAESSIERVHSITAFGLTKCFDKSLQRTLNLTTEAQSFLSRTENALIERLNAMQEESKRIHHEDVNPYIFYRFLKVKPHLQEVKEFIENLLDRKKAVESEALIEARSCNERPVTDMYNIMFVIEKTANACIQSL